MSKYTVVIKNRFLDEKTVARIKTYDDENEYGVNAIELAELTRGAIDGLIDNDIYFADVEEEDTDEENN